MQGGGYSGYTKMCLDYQANAKATKHDDHDPQNNKKTTTFKTPYRNNHKIRWAVLALSVDTKVSTKGLTMAVSSNG
jgi:hypothetical protein